jgi:cytoskeletal protein RodZ
MNSFPPDTSRDGGAPVAAPTSVHHDADIPCGELLRQARERRGLTLQQVAQSTKLPLRQLEALERDEFAALPGGMYRRAQVRAYAEAVGLDRNVAMAWLERSLEETRPHGVSAVHAPSPSKTAANNRRRAWTIAGVAVTGVAIAFALVARQPAEENRGRSAPVSAPASGVVPALYAPDRVSAAGSRNRLDPASAPQGQRSDPGAAPSATTGQEEPASPEETTATAASGSQLTVITEPEGARVTVDGIGRGTTPLTIRYLTPGTRRVRVTREGYLGEERVTEVKAGPGTVLRLRLRNAD